VEATAGTYLLGYSDASPAMVAEALKRKGPKLLVSLASAVKYAKKGKKFGGSIGRRGRGRPRTSLARVGSNGALNREAPVEVKWLAQRMGGIEKARAALAVLAKLALRSRSRRQHWPALESRFSSKATIPVRAGPTD